MQEQQEVESTEEESPVLGAARQYFTAIASESNELRDEMLGAKTRTKAKYFRKKLQANNMVALQLLERIAHLEKSKKSAMVQEDETANE